MIEPEIAFCDLHDDAGVAEEFLKYIIEAVLDERGDDMKFFAERMEQGLHRAPEGLRDRHASFAA
jgi:asparaginyl-tRNA synthetase